ncbi:hypothetical protein H5410_014821 [Solanum commersonii]|uniref:Uncharacterized protein n=1 Tax=Solanum commersonii TaxID=4109 RepID=A0A9J5ZRX4_SOLCO|nr:hypothetical protein H5410_014821 [Solanum commersonii]
MRSSSGILPSPTEWRWVVQLKKRLGVEALAAVMMNFDSDGIEEYNELVAALDKHEYGPNQRSKKSVW